MLSSNSCSSNAILFNFESEENASKWKKLFTTSLQKILSQVHPKMVAKEDALEYVESLILRLLAMLCSSPAPHSVQDVEDRVLRTFPNPIDQWATGDAQAAIEKGRKKTNLVLPVDRVHSQLKETLQVKFDYQVTLYIVAVLEYISADILKLAGSYVKNIKDDEVSQQDIRVAMCADKVLMDMFHQGESCDDPLIGILIEELPIFVDGSVTYEELVKHLIIDEKTFIRELHIIMKVFRGKLYEISALQGNFEKCQLDLIFSNINEVFEFSANFLSSLEDTIEVTKENELPAIGSCFEELAEGAEFDVFAKYAHDVLQNEWIDTLLALMNKPNVCQDLINIFPGFKTAVQYYLPRLLLVPVIHVFSYFKYIDCLLNVTDDEETKESLEQVKGVLCPLQSQLDRLIIVSPYSSYLKRKLSEVNSKHGRMTRQMSLQKLNEIQKLIDGWEGKDIAQCCSEFILEGPLRFGYFGRKQSDRHAFLFDGLLVLCKCKMNDYKLKEKFLMRMVEILDRPDIEDLRFSFEIRHRDLPSAILSAKSAEEKNNWMAALVRIDTQSMLERILDSILQSEEKQHPLRLPDSNLYPFSIEDSDENIVIEETENSGPPIIKGAVLFKLVERLTYHMYADPMFVRTFLTTYRSFTSPMEFLKLLIQRFEIPELQSELSFESDSSDVETQKTAAHRESLKRFRKEYLQPVQFRVLNVLRHWVDYHFYDFESDSELLSTLLCFLEDSVKGKSMKKWVDSITKIINRKCNEEPREITFSHNKSPPSPKVHLHMDERDWELAQFVEIGNTVTEPDQVRPLLMLHPIEIARQLTLLDFDLYRAVKPSELIGGHWTKEDKDILSPNLLKMIQHTNAVTNWLQKCVVECENFEERVAVLHRIVEILVMLCDLNNFSGVFQVSGALESAALHRLELTKNEMKKRLPPYQLKIYEEALDLGQNHHKRYLERLRSINPPCVPFVGIYLTNILHIEDGNPDFLVRGEAKGLINFSKRRKLAEITAEIQQYQNQPYCLEVNMKMKNFLESLSPFAGFASEHEVSNYLYHRSKEIEPKNCKKSLMKERRWPNIPLKSPGIKPRNNRSVPNPLPSMFGSSHKGASEGGQDGGDDASHQMTPPTPHTPATPPVSTNPADHSIFATVEIGTGLILPGRGDCRIGISGISSGHSGSLLNTASIPQTPNLQNSSSLPNPFPSYAPQQVISLPPPLPPRRRREHSVGDISPKVKQAADAPELPPRDVSPPPIPPRSAPLRPQSLSCSNSSALSSHSLPPQLHHVHHPHIPSYHQAPFFAAPPHLQYRLDPPPQRRRASSINLISQSCQAHDISHLGMSPSPDAVVKSEENESPPPPPPPPRSSTRLPSSFSYEQHHQHNK